MQTPNGVQGGRRSAPFKGEGLVVGAVAFSTNKNLPPPKKEMKSFFNPPFHVFKAGERNLPAEGEGFEPPARLRAPVFKTGVIDHSTILPIEFSLNRVQSYD